MKTVYQTCKMNNVIEVKEDELNNQLIVFKNGKYYDCIHDVNTIKAAYTAIDRLAVESVQMVNITI